MREAMYKLYISKKLEEKNFLNTANLKLLNVTGIYNSYTKYIQPGRVVFHITFSN